ncbi:MAG TPA: hypothetical protein DEF92_07760 [Leclercia adecarboxylata]|nr:hypothetical protein [Leclercia adecarboxylata]
MANLTGNEISELSIRETYEIDVTKASVEINIVHPEKVILRTMRGVYDLGILCYKKRYMYDPDNPDKNRRVQKVDKRKVVINSLDVTRYEVVNETIKAVISGSMRAVDVRSVVHFINFIDRNYDYPNLSEIDVEHAYINYTKYLFEHIELSNISKLSTIPRKVAYMLQRCAAFVTAVMTGKSPEQIKSLTYVITVIQSLENQPSIQTQLEVQDKVFAAHVKIFCAITEFLINKKPFPLIVEGSQAIGMNKVIYFSKYTHSQNEYQATDNKQWPRFVFTEDGMLGWIEAREQALKVGVEIGPAYGREYQNYYAQISEYKKRNLKRHDLIYRELANIAVRHFVHAIIADSGCNISVLLSALIQDVHKLKGVDKTQLLSIKGRAGYDRQKIEITNRFLPYYRQYIRLREWMVSSNVNNNNLIVNFTKGNRGVIAHKVGFEHWREACLSSPFFPKNLPYINLRDYRKGVSYHYLGITDGDIGYVSGVLGNSPETARKHYAFKHIADSAKEVHLFFEQFKKSCLVKSKDSPVAVRVVVDAPKINSGRCTCTPIEAPSLIDGFNSNAPMPDCDAPIACFFCEHYGIHADEIDITRILSVREYITVQSKSKSRNINEHYIKFLPIIDRIDEIVEQFKLTQPNADDIINNAKENIVFGRLDPYWSVKINALIDGGVL